MKKILFFFWFTTQNAFWALLRCYGYFFKHHQIPIVLVVGVSNKKQEKLAHNEMTKLVCKLKKII